MKKLLTIILSLIVVVIILLVISYNFFTSQYGIKNFILPYVAEKTGAKLSMGNISFSGLNSSLLITDLNYSADKMTVKADAISLKTSLSDVIFDHKINIKSLDLKNADVFIDITRKDKLSGNEEKCSIGNDTSKSSNEKAESKAVSKNGSKWKISLNNIDFNHVNITVKNGKTVTKISELNLKIPKMTPDRDAVILIDSKLSMADGKKVLDGYVNSKSDIELNDDFLPKKINSQSVVELGGNKMPVVVKLDTAPDNKFNFSFDISSIMIEPFAEAFVPGVYGKTKGSVSSLILEMSGKNIENLVSGKGSVDTKFSINGINIYNEGLFSLKNKLISTEFDLNEAVNARVIPDKFSIKQLNASYINKEQKINIDDFNIGLFKKADNSVRAIINTSFVYQKGDKELTGSLAGNIGASGNFNKKPDLAYANLNFNSDGNNIPIKIRYTNNKNEEKAELEIRNIVFQPFIDFAMKHNSKLSGTLNSINVVISGNENVFEHLKDNNKNINAQVRLTGLDFQNPEKYSVEFKEFVTSMNLNNILNKKYYLDKLHLTDPKILVIKTGNNETVKKTDIQKTVQNKEENKIAVDKNTKTGTDQSNTKQKYDFDIKDIAIKGGHVEFVSNKKLVCSNLSIASEGIKSDKLSSFDFGTDYNIDRKVRGNIFSNNNVLITSELVPEVFKSSIRLTNNGNISNSKINFSGKNNNDKLSYNIDAEIHDLLLNPFLMAFVAPPYNKAETDVDSLSVKLNGDNIAEPLKGKGEISGTLSEMSVPVDVKEDNIIEALFFPLRVIAEFASNTGLKFVSGDVANAMIKIDNTFNQKKAISFKQADIGIGINSGVLNINKFDFLGDSDSPVSEIKVLGTINMNNQALNLNTNTVFAGLDIPLEVNGTIKKPETDTSKLAAELLQKNAGTIVKTGVDMTDTINNTVKNIRNKNFDKLLENIPGSSNQNNSGNTVDQLLNAVKGQVSSQSEQQTQNSDTSNQSSNNKSSNTVNQILGVLQNTAKQIDKNQSSGKSSQSSGDVSSKIGDLLNF